MYESLLLRYGGGILPSLQQVKQHRESATVVIGLGGTGIAALAELKRKVYRHLEPDNPGDPVPRYDHIRFLAIDSNGEEIHHMQLEYKLDPSVFFSLDAHAHGLQSTPDWKASVKSDPRFYWMDVDRLFPLRSPLRYDGVRQIGRYLLLRNATHLKAKLSQICMEALQGLHASALDIYLFAGLSGATGGGGFLDLCYIVRNVLEDLGLEACGQVTGFFFLPEVTTSKPGMDGNDACIAYNRANGYAALKELDYHMALKEANDFFAQNYGSFSVHTQNAPVDLCYLISTSHTGGTADAFDRSVHTAADYVMHLLYLPPPSDSLSFSGRLSCMLRGSSAISHAHGAHFCYHTLGSAKAGVPTAQITTYLAAGFFRNFQRYIGRGKAAVAKPIVDDLVQELGLTIQQVHKELVRGCDSLSLPEINAKELAACGPMSTGQIPQPLANPGNIWLDRCAGRRARNRTVLSVPLTSFDVDKVPAGSLTGKIFCKLYKLSMSPDYGPYYTANLLCSGGYNLMAALDGAIHQAEMEQHLLKSKLHGNGPDSWDARLEQCRADFLHSSFFNRTHNYHRYMDAIRQWYLVRNRYNACSDLAATLCALKSSLTQLYESYFAPLITLLDGLDETFSDNLQALNDGKLSPPPCTRFLVSLNNLRPQLDKTVEQLAGNDSVIAFMDYLLKGYDQWQAGDDGRIGRYISRYMETVFHQQISRSLEDYLFDAFPQAHGMDDLLAQEIQSHITQLHMDALSMFWHSRLFSDPYDFPVAGEFLTPASPALSAAIDFFRSNFPYYREGISYNQSISVLLLAFGISLYAYDGMSVLKNAYDQAIGHASGAGIHLYAYTGRGEDGSGQKDWGAFLPDPVPCSCMETPSPKAQALLALYARGEAAGILCQSPHTGNYVILRTAPLELPAYTLDGFMDDGVFQCHLWEQAHEDLVQKLAGFHAPGAVVEEIRLTDDGNPGLGRDVVAQVRTDHFLSYPKLQALVQDELDKLDSLQTGIHTLETIRSEYEAYEADSSCFFDLIFYGILSCTNGRGYPSFFVNPFGAAAFRPISRITYGYTDLCGIAQEQVFSQDGAPGLPYSSTYPLYQAFLTYRSLSPLDPVRVALDRAVSERRKMLLQPGDNLIARSLAEQWNPQTLSDLAGRLALVPMDEGRSLLRFYDHLVQAIGRFHDQFRCEDWDDLSACPPTPDAQAGVWTLRDHDRYLYLYEHLGSNTAWDPAAGVWVPVSAGMELWNPIQLCWNTITDENGYLHISHQA